MSLSKLEEWYANRCNGDWEHSYGVSIETLDNPGWSIKVDLRETEKQDSVLAKNKIDRTESDWILYWVENRQFRIACGPQNLSEAIEIFVRWFKSKSDL